MKHTKYYIFDVWIEKTGICEVESKILRKIQIAGTKSLYSFAKTIIKAFKFSFDHCFGFYDNFQRYHDSQKAYELFVDIGEEPLSPNTKGVKKTKIQQAFKKPREKMLFFFDYGDCWRFVVELKEIKKAEKHDIKPVILESIGDPPPQYPPCNEGEPILDDLTIKTIRKFTTQIEQFLKACKDEGDIIIDDVLKRLEDLRKDT